MVFLEQLKYSISSNTHNNALCIDGIFYSYQNLSDKILSIRKLIHSQIGDEEKVIGLICTDSLETYASIFALWFEGKGYVPINPSAPNIRNIEILNSTQTKNVLSSETINFLDNFSVYNTSTCTTDCDEELKNITYNETDIAYVLFTSGSTGKPKGIPISFKNLNSLLTSLENDKEYSLNEFDKCLQMYDLTFDASLTAFMPAFLAGACSYTIAPNSMKYLEVFKLLQKYKLTVLKMVPSIIYYLKPYFSEIHANSVRYCVFGGGKLYEDTLKEWASCVPNSKIYNHYGPTECTVCSTYYTFKRIGENKSHNGVLSIGKPLSGIDFMIIDDKNNNVSIGQEGELCLSSKQLTEGYWKNEKLNEISFFNVNTKSNKKKRFYKTGDLCYADREGDIMYVGRKDFQVKIRGFRIELGEIEYHVKKILTNYNSIVLDINNELGNNELFLIIESNQFDVDPIIKHLKTKLPNYMVPTQVRFIDTIPHNTNGKIDRQKLQKHISHEKSNNTEQNW